MEIYIVYDQRDPIPLGRENYRANLVEMGRIEASSLEAAMKIAMEKKLSRHPVLGGRSIERLCDKYRRQQQGSRRYHD